MLPGKPMGAVSVFMTGNYLEDDDDVSFLLELVVVVLLFL